MSKISQKINAVNLITRLYCCYTTQKTPLTKKMCQNTNQAIKRHATGKTSGQLSKTKTKTLQESVDQERGLQNVGPASCSASHLSTNSMTMLQIYSQLQWSVFIIELSTVFRVDPQTRSLASPFVLAVQIALSHPLVEYCFVFVVHHPVVSPRGAYCRSYLPVAESELHQNCLPQLQLECFSFFP